MKCWESGFYKERLKALVTQVEAMGAVPIFVTQTARYFKKDENGKMIGASDVIPYKDQKVNGVDIYHVLNLFNQATMEVCELAEGICIDLANELEFDDDDFYDWAHVTPKGTKKIGDYLYRNLREQDIPLFASKIS